MDNITRTGTVIQVGKSTVGSDPYVIVYAYDVPGYPRNGNRGSYTREQVTTAKNLARFAPGMKIKVERSKVIPGASRLKGYGGGSVLFNDLF